MKKPECIKELEVQDSVVEIKSNCYQKNVMYSLIAEKNNKIYIFNSNGELLHELGPGPSFVVTHEWVSPVVIAAVYKDGTMRTWEIKGAKSEFKRIKEKVRGDVKCIVSLNPPSSFSRNIDFLITFQDGALARLKNNEFSKLQVQVGGNISCCHSFNGKIYFATDDKGLLKIHSMELTLDGLNSFQIFQVEDGLNKFRVIGHPNKNTLACLLLSGGKLQTWNLENKKTHLMKSDDHAEDFSLDNASRSLAVAFKSGIVEFLPLGENYTFKEFTSRFTAHEFRLSSIFLDGKNKILITTDIAGIVKFWKVPAELLPSKNASKVSAVDKWMIKEQVTQKIKIAKDALAKGRIEKARAIIQDLKGKVSKEFKMELNNIEQEIDMTLKASEKEKQMEEKLVSFLNEVSMDRGEILIDEIAQETKIPKKKVIELIKKLSFELEWEFVEEHECLFLFGRESMITEKISLEREPRSYQKQRERNWQRSHNKRARMDYHRPDTRRYSRANVRETSRQKSGSRLRDRREGQLPREIRLPPGFQLSKNQANILKSSYSLILNKMKAIIFEKNTNKGKTVALTNLMNELEKMKGNINYIITDGIISPRLVEMASEKNAKLILGRRIHPKLSNASNNVACMVLSDLDSFISGTKQEISGEKISQDENEPLTPVKIEQYILKFLKDKKWHDAKSIERGTGVSDPFDVQIFKVKLKQLLQAGKIESDSYNNETYYKLK
ncbi:MAG: hypothetical protein ACTSVI_08465 [Promethearchaeota archaeon]